MTPDLPEWPRLSEDPRLAPYAKVVDLSEATGDLTPDDPPAYGVGTHVYRCVQCGTIIRSIAPYTADPEPWHRGEMIFDKNPLPGFSAGIIPCGPLHKIEGTGLAAIVEDEQ